MTNVFGKLIDENDKEYIDDFEEGEADNYNADTEQNIGNYFVIEILLHYHI